MSIIEYDRLASIVDMSRAEAISRGRAPSPLSTPDLFDDLSFLLARANALSLAAGNAALSQHGLRVRSYSVLALAAGPRQPTQRELAELLRLDPSQVVALVDDLQNRGLVTRQSDPSDRRANVVVATEDGKVACEVASIAAAAAQDEQLLNVLSPSERAQLAELLRRIAFPEDRHV